MSKGLITKNLLNDIESITEGWSNEELHSLFLSVEFLITNQILENKKELS